VVLASEPYDDDPDWEDVPDRYLVAVTGSCVALTSLAAADHLKGP
jgi:gamma-glutamyl hercynylcysteine S-oxide hydrolase